MHYILAVIILTVYGSQVDKMMAALPPINLGTGLLIAYAVAYGFRRLLEKRIVILADDLSQPRRQFLFDFSLNIRAGLLAATLNTAIYGYSILSLLSSWFIGMTTIIGYFIALDTSLARERTILLVASKHNTFTTAPKRFRSITRRFFTVAVVTAISGTVVIILVISLDMTWLTRVETNPVSIADRPSGDITYEILFIIRELSAWTWDSDPIYSYARNLKLLFKNETRVLERT